MSETGKTMPVYFRIPAPILASVKADASREGVTLTAWVIDAIGRKLSRHAGDAESGECSVHASGCRGQETHP